MRPRENRSLHHAGLGEVEHFRKCDRKCIDFFFCFLFCIFLQKSTDSHTPCLDINYINYICFASEGIYDSPILFFSEDKFPLAHFACKKGLEPVKVPAQSVLILLYGFLIVIFPNKTPPFEQRRRRHAAGLSKGA